MSQYDNEAARRIRPGGRLLVREATNLDVLLEASKLLDQFGSGSSECRQAAEALRRLARSIASALQADGIFKEKT